MLGRRHDYLRRTLRDKATTAGMIAEEEPRGLPGFGNCGGDLLVHNVHPGKAIVADVCVVSEHVEALAKAASCRAGHAAKLAEHRKRQKYEPACQQLGLGFLSLAKRDGAFGKGLQEFIARSHCPWHNHRRYHPGGVLLLLVLAPKNFSVPQKGDGDSSAEVPAEKLPR